nr:PREDICTED: uncharacterized protein LOC107789831 [Nicotiana tabacum]
MAEYKACILGIKIAVDMNVNELLVIGDSDLLIQQVQGKWSTKNVNILLYLHCVKELCKEFAMIEFKNVPKIQNNFVDALATLPSMIQHPGKNYIDPIKVEIMDQHAYCFHVDEEPDGKPWYHDIRNFLATREYPENATNGQKLALRRLANHFFLNGEVLYRRTPELGFLRNVDIAEFETSTYKAITKKVVEYFVRNNIVCIFGIPECIINGNVANLNSDPMREICEKFRIVHRNSTAYRP